MRMRTLKMIVGIFMLALFTLGNGNIVIGQTVGGANPELTTEGDILDRDVAAAIGETPDGKAFSGDSETADSIGLIDANGEVDPPDPSAVALDTDGMPYPEGGPSGLYGAIVDKQVKTLDGGGTSGNSNALSRLRRNLSRWLEKKGILGDGTSDRGDIGIDEAADSENEAVPDLVSVEENGEVDPPDPSAVALDVDGTPYPAGGPPGLYSAIVDKQVKTLDGGGTSGNSNALSRLRRNLSRWLEKKGLLGEDTPDMADTGMGSPDGIRTEEMGIAAAKVPYKIDKVKKVDRLPKPGKVEKAQRPEKPFKPEMGSRPERPDKVKKPSRPEKPSKPDKPSRPRK